MKRGRRFLALFLSLGILFTMLPTAFAVEAEESSIAGQYAILGLTISESEPNTASVQLIAESNCTLEVALFSAEGQMLWAGNTLVRGKWLLP